MLMSQYVGALHGLLLSAVVISGTGGPVMLSFLREMEVQKAIQSLVHKIDPAA